MAAALGLLVFLAALFAAVKYLPGPEVLGREEPDGTRFRVSHQRDGRLRRQQRAGRRRHADLRSLAGSLDRPFLGALRHGQSRLVRARLLAAPARGRGASGADHAPPEADRPRAESARVRRRSQDVGLRALADRPRSAGRRVRLRAVRAPRRDHAADGLLADRLVDLPRDPLRLPGLPALDLGRDRGAVRADAAVGRSGARPLLLLDRRLDPARPARADGDAGAARDRGALRREPLDVPQRQRAEVALQTGPEVGDLGRAGRGDRRPPADLGLVGDRPPPQLHRRDRGLPGAHARDRLRARTCPICSRSGCSCCSSTAPTATTAAAGRNTERSGTPTAPTRASACSRSCTEAAGPASVQQIEDVAFGIAGGAGLELGQAMDLARSSRARARAPSTPRIGSGRRGCWR